MYINPTYLIFMLPALILSLICQFKVKSTYAKYDKVGNDRRITGAEAAQRVLRGGGVFDVSVGKIGGTLTDHFDPGSKSINLSAAVHDKSTIASVGIAAHEAGHAIQHNEGYGPIKLRTALVPVCNIGSSVGPWLIILGLILGIGELYYVGLIAFGAVALFQLVTLPVEFNASRRAMEALESSGTLSDDELKGARRVLTAAAMTYVAALVTSIMQILYYVSMSNRRR